MGERSTARLPFPASFPTSFSLLPLPLSLGYGRLPNADRARHHMYTLQPIHRKRTMQRNNHPHEHRNKVKNTMTLSRALNHRGIPKTLRKCEDGQATQSTPYHRPIYHVVCTFGYSLELRPKSSNTESSPISPSAYYPNTRSSTA